MLREEFYIKSFEMVKIQKNSWKDFHAPGVDYVCLKQTPDLTVKAYFIDEGCEGHLVNPHDHRYDFATTVVRGAVTNIVFRELNQYPIPNYHRYEYKTPLNGGNGFTYDRPAGLNVAYEDKYVEGERYVLDGTEIHTLAHIAPQTVLLLWQYKDFKQLYEPTATFMKEKKELSSKGLYNRFNQDGLVDRLEQLHALGVDIWL